MEKLKDLLPKQKINEGTLANYYNRADPPTRTAARKVDDLLKTLISDKKQLDKLTDLITDLANEYAEERIYNSDMDKLDESLDDMDVSLPVQVNKFLDKTVNAVKSYNLSRKKEQLIIAKIIDALGVDKSQLGQTISKIKRYGIVQKEGIWPKSKLASTFQIRLAAEFKKNFKGIFYGVGNDIYYNDKKVLTVDGDRDNINTIVAKLKKIIR